MKETRKNFHYQALVVISIYSFPSTPTPLCNAWCGFSSTVISMTIHSKYERFNSPSHHWCTKKEKKCAFIYINLNHFSGIPSSQLSWRVKDEGEGEKQDKKTETKKKNATSPLKIHINSIYTCQVRKYTQISNCHIIHLVIEELSKLKPF